jgi:hypothetical protein
MRAEFGGGMLNDAARSPRGMSAGFLWLLTPQSFCHIASQAYGAELFDKFYHAVFRGFFRMNNMAVVTTVPAAIAMT